MDVPRELVYEERTSLDEFDYKDPKSINGQLFLKGLAKIAEMKTGEPGFKSRLLRVYNDAYYICTFTTVRLNFTKAKVGGHFPDFD